VAEIEVTDPAWVRDYVARVTPMVERHGGRYLARTPKVQVLEGERKRAQTLLLIEWPSKKAAEAFYDNDEYRPSRERRRSGARNEFVMVAGEDAAGVARMRR
jgi:uncharacterized protein (DUF1330 family)